MKVLLVEDDVRIAAAVRRGLEAEGFTVDVAGDGDAGLWQATEGTYDVIVLDLLLPGRNGFRVCADLRAAGDWTPILVLTAKAGELDEAEALDTGADDYLTKPFSFPVLLARLRALVRRSTDSGGSVTQVGDLRIDELARRASVGGHEVELTAREFDVLSFLARRSGQVLSKRDILGGVWEYDFDGDPNIVEVYVGRLRRKLQVHGGPAPIETVRGAGYLVRNAARHATQRLEVAVGGDDQRAVVEVCDDGPGVPAAERERIFERFARLDDGRSRDAGGTGLGLAIARDIARVHGGEVTVGDRPGGGASFRLVVPASTEHR